MAVFRDIPRRKPCDRVCSPGLMPATMGRSGGPRWPGIPALRLLLLLLTALSRRPVAALTTPPPPDGQLDRLGEELSEEELGRLSETELGQLSDEELRQLYYQELDALRTPLPATERSSGVSAKANTSERYRRCKESALEEPPPSHCHVTWDRALCWPAAPPGQLVRIDCFTELRGVHYDNSRNSKSPDQGRKSS